MALHNDTLRSSVLRSSNLPAARGIEALRSAVEQSFFLVQVWTQVLTSYKTFWNNDTINLTYLKV